MSHCQDVIEYFAYGSNLLKERIELNNPTAANPRVGKLKGYRFSFETTEFLENTYGIEAPATIVTGNSTDYLYGVVWQIDANQICHLDRQEGHYMAISVDVELEDGSTIVCRTYQLIGEYTGNHLTFPCYKKIIVEGAKQNGLPEDYIRFLEGLKDSGNQKIPERYKAVMKALEDKN